MSRLSVPLRVLPALLTLCASAGCNSGCSQHDRPDAADGGALDASADSLDILALDARDARGPDVGDAAREGGEPGWTWVPSPAPADCLLERADDPAATIQPFRWEPCADGRAGCQQLVVAWGIHGSRDEHLGHIVAGYHDGTTGWLALEQVARDVLIERMVVGPVNGPPVAAWQYPGYQLADDARCLLTFPAMGDDTYALILMAEIVQPDHFAWMPIRGSLSTRGRDLLGPAAYFDRPPMVGLLAFGAVVNRTLWADALRSPGIARATDTRLDRADTVDQPGESGVAIDGTDVVYVRQSMTTGRHDALILRPIDGPPYVLYQQPNCEFIDVFIDGTYLAWHCEVDYVRPGVYSRVDAWTSPWSRDPSQIRPRYLGPSSLEAVLLPYSMLGHDHFAVNMWPNSIRVFNLAGSAYGSYWDLTPPAGTNFSNFLYLGPEEFAVDLWPGGSYSSGIIRQRYSDLGPAMPAVPRP